MISSVADYAAQVARASSRLLNALTGGEGDTTFSAQSEWLRLRGRPCGRVRVAILDRLFGAGHCRAAYLWHHDRRLFQRDR